MTAMTTTALPANEWTVLYTAAGAVTITVQNQSKASEIRLRIAAGAGVGDAATAAADILQPLERASVTLAASDVVMARPVSAESGPCSINVRA